MPEDVSLREEQKSAVSKVKYWIYTKTKMKFLDCCPITSLGVGRFLKSVSENLKSKGLPSFQTSIAEACEYEITVHYNEALLEYNNVFREAHADRQLDEVKTEAKKQALETFMRCSAARQGNQEAFKAYLNKLMQGFHSKDKLVTNPATGKVQPKQVDPSVDKKVSYDSWATMNRIDTTDDTLIPEKYPDYIENWEQIYPSLFENEELVKKFAQSNVDVVTKYKNYLKGLEDNQLGHQSEMTKLMKQIDVMKDQKTATYKKLEDLRKDKTRLSAEEEKLKKEKDRDGLKLNEAVAQANYQELEKQNEVLKALIRDHETEIAELDKKIAAEKSKPQSSCCSLI